jgi:UDP-glucose 4-epimerase
MNILVTGGAGYIGSVTVEELLREGERVIVYDSLVRGHRAAVDPRATFVQGDLSDIGQLEEAFERHEVEAVIHFAAYIEAGESMEKPALYFSNNVANTIRLLGVALAKGAKRFVFSSSAAVYGEPQGVPIEESAPTRPINPYGEAKAMVERVLGWLEKAHGLRYASLRYFNAAGASERYGEDHRPESHLIPLALQVALGKRDSLEIYGSDYPTRDGTCVRDYIHVVDLARAHILALRALEDKSVIYNLGNGQGFTVKEVIERAREVTGHPIPSIEGPRRPGDPVALVASAEKIKRELGWEPCFPHLEAIIESAWRWHRSHPEGYGE